MIRRIIAAYHRAIAVEPPSPGSMWGTGLQDIKSDVHSALMGGDPVECQRMLDHPEQNNLLYGFEAIAASLPATPPNAAGACVRAQATLNRLCEAVGAIRLHNPEAEPVRRDVPADDALSALACVGLSPIFPNPYAGEMGLPTSKGLASETALRAVYNAWRLKRFSPVRVAEIGAGLGRTAFYAWNMGMRRYSIFDIPLTLAAQAWWLSRVLGPDAICLFGENQPNLQCIRLLPPVAFLSRPDHYDVVMNVDSWPEMAPETAKAYVQAAEKRARVVWSVNHEFNPVRVWDLWTEQQAIDRRPYALRTGYSDETYSPL